MGAKKSKGTFRVCARPVSEKKTTCGVCEFSSSNKKGSHPLWIFTKEGQVQKLRTKAEIANALAELVTQPEAESF